MDGHMNRTGARHVGEPAVYGAKGSRLSCIYAATMIAKHMPAFADIAHEFEAILRPPATIALMRPGDPDAALTYEIPALLLPASVAEQPKQVEL